MDFGDTYVVTFDVPRVLFLFDGFDFRATRQHAGLATGCASGRFLAALIEGQGRIHDEQQQAACHSRVQKWASCIHMSFLKSLVTVK